jgi:prepilin-type N-terminal cleavage/methylation domain-containing protein
MLHHHRQDGFSLIETLAALTVFTIVTLGVTPLLISSMRGASLSRSFTKGKNVAVEAMERIRGLPFFVSVGSVTPVTQPRVDVLDLYFPDMGSSGSSGYQSATSTFVTNCTANSDSPAPSGPLACPARVPAGHTVKFEATFVTPSGSGFVPVAPSGYNWNSTSTETPPSPLLKMVVIVLWTHGGATRTTTLTTLLGERDLADDEVRGSGDIDYVVQGRTGYVDSGGIPSNVVAVVGSAESSIESRTVTAADQTVESGRVTLTREEVGSEQAVTLADEFGAVASHHAPPNSYPAPDVVGGPVAVTHPDFGQPVATLGLNVADSLGVKVEDDLPAAIGGFAFNAPLVPDVEIFNDIGVRGLNELRLVAGAMLGTERVGLTQLSGQTTAHATALSPTAAREVEATATADLPKLRLLPATFVTHPDGAVIVITDFTASVSCRATASAPTADASGSWSATLHYWADSNPGDGIALGQYVSVPLSGAVGSTATDPLAELRQNSNPLVFDHAEPDKDVYLFEDGTVPGYITEWSSRPQVQSSIDTSGRRSAVDLDGAIQIVTTAVNPDVQRSNIAVSVGAMSCEAVDKRGL